MEVVWGFPGCGKSTFAKENPQMNIIDADSALFQFCGVSDEELHGNHDGDVRRNEDYPANYIEFVKNVNADVVLINCHLSLLEQFENVTIVYPDKALKEEYLQRYQERGDNESFIRYMEESFEQMVAFIESMDGFDKVKMTETDMFLKDVLRTGKKKTVMSHDELRLSLDEQIKGAKKKQKEIVEERKEQRLVIRGIHGNPDVLFFPEKVEEYEAFENEMKANEEAWRELIQSGYDAFEFETERGQKVVLSPSVRKGVDWQLTIFTKQGDAILHRNFYKDHIEDLVSQLSLYSLGHDAKVKTKKNNLEF